MPPEAAFCPPPNNLDMAPPVRAEAIPPAIAFFFSSRRRHTRFDCDWSSDVCSSDLQTARRRRRKQLRISVRRNGEHSVGRSEERRVGKECSSLVIGSQHNT